MAFACLRYTHITRSEPRRLTQGFCIVAAPNGKKKHHRDGFDYAIPASLSNGFFWEKEIIEALRTLAPSRQRTCGLCICFEGRPWAIGEVQEATQTESDADVLVDNADEITTYSWRRVGPTLVQFLECKPEIMSALEDWQTKGDGSEIGQMALHSSSAKYAASFKAKSLVWGASARLRRTGWLKLIVFCVKIASQSGTRHRSSRTSRRGSSSREKARDLRLQQKLLPGPCPTMRATLKNSKPLYPDFQTDECPNPAESCPFGAPLCAVLQQSGRACGGQTWAQVSRIKCAVLVTTSEPSATLVPAATVVPGRTKFGRKASREKAALPIAAPPPKRAK